MKPIVRSALLVVVVVVASSSACDRGPPHPGDAPPPPPAPKPSSAAPRSTAAAPLPTVEAPVEAVGLAGKWEGSYEATKASVTRPEKVPDKGRDADDGTLAIGKGTITLVVSPKGEVSGRWTGALGRNHLTGKADGDMLRVSAFPEDFKAPGAMSGIVIGKLDGDVIHAKIQASGGDALIVREADVDLARKP